MRSPFKALRSIKLAIALLAYFAATGIAASIPATGFSSFYSSPFFLFPAFLFFANLSSCAAYRFAKELKKERRRRRHGPDLLHFGLVLLVASVVASRAAVQMSAESRGFVKLRSGEAVQLSGDRVLLLKSARVDRYPDGRPRDFVSVVELWKDGQLLIPEREIGVNRPLRLGGLSIRQTAFDEAAATSGLLASYDPLFPAIAASLGIAALGICLSFLQRPADRRLSR
jgi:cytochrome c biogenesis protein ResB